MCGAGFAGSRSGALISTAWASMVHQGEEGYLSLTKLMLEVTLYAHLLTFTSNKAGLSLAETEILPQNGATHGSCLIGVYGLEVNI